MLVFVLKRSTSRGECEGHLCTFFSLFRYFGAARRTNGFAYSLLSTCAIAKWTSLISFTNAVRHKWNILRNLNVCTRSQSQFRRISTLCGYECFSAVSYFNDQNSSASHFLSQFAKKYNRNFGWQWEDLRPNRKLFV